MNFKRTLRKLFLYRKLIFVILYPILLSPMLIIYNTKAAKGAFALLLISGLWITEAISIYVTALLPAVLGPLMGIVDTETICQLYMKDAIMLFLGGAFIAVAVEHTGTHLRVGYFILNLIPKSNAMILLGFMIISYFLSMWISNAATTMMILTISEALMNRIREYETEKLNEGNASSEDGSAHKNRENNNRHVAEFSQLGDEGKGARDGLYTLEVAVSLGIAYGSTCGGIATLIGTPTNVVFAGIIKSSFGINVDFTAWLKFALPLSLICLFVAWVIVCLYFFKFKELFSCKSEGTEQEIRITAIVNKAKVELGPIRWSEGICMTVLGLTILLWISREPGVPGWSRYINTDGKRYISDTQVAVLAAAILMVIPSRNPFTHSVSEEDEVHTIEPLLPWSVALKLCPWSVPIIIGGGFAIAKITKDSGFSTVIDEVLQIIRNWPPQALVVVFTVFGAIATTFIANAAVFALLAAIAFEMCESTNMHPYYLGLPLAVASSLSFILPASTPANAIVYDKGRVQLKDMVLSGSLICIVCVIVTILCTISYAVPMYQLDVPFTSHLISANTTVAFMMTTPMNTTAGG